MRTRAPPPPGPPSATVGSANRSSTSIGSDRPPRAPPPRRSPRPPAGAERRAPPFLLARAALLRLLDQPHDGREALRQLFLLRDVRRGWRRAAEGAQQSDHDRGELPAAHRGRLRHRAFTGARTTPSTTCGVLARKPSRK